MSDRESKKIGFVCAWYDFWIGIYYSQSKGRLYILPLPFVGVWIQLKGGKK